MLGDDYKSWGEGWCWRIGQLGGALWGSGCVSDGLNIPLSRGHRLRSLGVKANGKGIGGELR